MLEKHSKHLNSLNSNRIIVNNGNSHSNNISSLALIPTHLLEINFFNSFKASDLPKLLKLLRKVKLRPRSRQLLQLDLLTQLLPLVPRSMPTLREVEELQGDLEVAEETSLMDVEEEEVLEGAGSQMELVHLHLLKHCEE